MNIYICNIIYDIFLWLFLFVFRGVIISVKYGGSYNDNYSHGIMGIMQDCAELCFISFLFGLNRFPMATLIFNTVDPHCHFLGRHFDRSKSFSPASVPMNWFPTGEDNPYIVLICFGANLSHVTKTMSSETSKNQGQEAQSIHAQHFQTSKFLVTE